MINRPFKINEHDIHLDINLAVEIFNTTDDFLKTSAPIFVKTLFLILLIYEITPLFSIRLFLIYPDIVL